MHESSRLDCAFPQIAASDSCVAANVQPSSRTQAGSKSAPAQVETESPSCTIIRPVFRSRYNSSESVRGVIRAHPRTRPDWFVRRGGRARAFGVRVVFPCTTRRRSTRAPEDETNDPRPVRGAPHLRFARVDQAEEARSGEQAAQSVSRENWQSRVVIVAKRRVQSARFEYT